MAIKIYREGNMVVHESTNDDLGRKVAIESNIQYFWPKDAYFCSYDINLNTYSLSRFNGSEEFNICNGLVYSQFEDKDGNPFTSNNELKFYLAALLGDSSTGTISTANSTTTELDADGVFTGEWEDVTGFDSVIACKWITIFIFKLTVY